MRTSSKKMLTEIRHIQTERQRLLDELLQPGDVTPGPVATVLGKCGKAGCHCADGPGHPHLLLLFRGVDGKRGTKHVRKADEQRIREAGERYRRFKAGLRRLRTMYKRELQILMAILKWKTVSYK